MIFVVVFVVAAAAVAAVADDIDSSFLWVDLRKVFLRWF